MSIRKWLRENSYSDVADLIDQVSAQIVATGSRQRRNWWDTLAGQAGGTPIIVNGQPFPVLRAAQLRQGKPVTYDALSRNENEQVPEIKQTGRWPKSQKRLPAQTRANAVAKKPTRQVQGRAS